MDAPKCLQCVDLQGETPFAQTYRVIGKLQSFKCSRCKKVLPRDAFTEVEFKWRLERGAWDSFISNFVSQKIEKEMLDEGIKVGVLEKERAKLDALEKATRPEKGLKDVA